jgi:hypothetical protein
MEAVERGYEQRLHVLAHEYREELRRIRQAQREEVKLLTWELDACRRDKQALRQGISEAICCAEPAASPLRTEEAAGEDCGDGGGMAVVELTLSGGVVWPGELAGDDSTALRRVTDEVRRDVARAAGVEAERVLVRDVRTALEVLLLAGPSDPAHPHGHPPPGAGAARPAGMDGAGDGGDGDMRAAAARLVADAADPGGALLQGGQTWRTVRAVMKAGRNGPPGPVRRMSGAAEGGPGSTGSRMDAGEQGGGKGGAAGRDGRAVSGESGESGGEGDGEEALGRLERRMRDLVRAGGGTRMGRGGGEAVGLGSAGDERDVMAGMDRRDFEVWARPGSFLLSHIHTQARTHTFYLSPCVILSHTHSLSLSLSAALPYSPSNETQRSTHTETHSNMRAPPTLPHPCTQRKKTLSRTYLHVLFSRMCVACYLRLPFLYSVCSVRARTCTRGFSGAYP